MGYYALANTKQPLFESPTKQFDLSSLQKTFFCIGPVCLRSGYGLGLGVGCGLGFGRGFALMDLSSQGVGSTGGIPTQFLYGLPFGHYVSGFLQNLARKFPGSSTGIGCGFGLGYGVGIGLQYGAGGRLSFGNRGHLDNFGSSHFERQVTPLEGSKGPSPQTENVEEKQRYNMKLEALEKRLKGVEEKLDVYFKLSELERRLESLEKQKKR
ncbi:hypothetical protein GAYE_SCF01G2058 [Galdieria yellowstonensis]|uniref:Uncharacterized protein n=1 Tax=Galdieria yellowstonensis TaxID=3028027 RepID=A0AAV9IA17_9RHOD|nr:hypothetical protein GAYE_HPESCF16G0144 [Galdieria yellowstonensis]KAK4524159.1 hypothetical protein GAYE_SCF01G2058 [Galdieria yellowstonensis]